MLGATVFAALAAVATMRSTAADTAILNTPFFTVLVNAATADADSLKQNASNAQVA
jgi:hypothetical protein